MAKKAVIAAAAAVDPETSTTTVNIADFQRTRDSVIVALATLQSSVSDLSRAYINHANTVLAPGRIGGLDANLTTMLADSGLLVSQPVSGVVAVPIDPELMEGKKKRKRTPHDPNAPKRALTPYFLYMQTARAQIAKELGDQAKPKEVADEGTRRWTAMPPAEKSVWDDKYQKNLAAYRVKMAAYKAGQLVPTDDEAARLVEAGKAPAHVAGVDPEIDTEEDVAPIVETSEEEEEDEEPTPPVREPSPPKSKRRKTNEKTPAKEPAKTAGKTPEKKGKKAKKEATPPPAPPVVKASDKKKKSKK